MEGGWKVEEMKKGRRGDGEAVGEVQAVHP